MKFEKTFQNEKIEDWSVKYINLHKLKELSNRDYLSEDDSLNLKIEEFDKFLKNELNSINIFYNIEINEINNDIELLSKCKTFNTNEINFKNISEKCDKLRQYVILNCVAVIKLIKRRNKRTPKILETKSELEKHDFYKCKQLKSAFRELKSISDNAKLNYASKLMGNVNTIISYRSLAAIRENCKFEDFNYLPHYDLKKIDDKDIEYYLDAKLGPNNCLDEIIIKDEELDIIDIPDDSNTS